MEYAVLLALVLADGVVPLVPSEMALLATVATVSGLPALLLLGAAVALAAHLGDRVTFALGRRVGTDRWAWMRRPRVARLLARTKAQLDRRGARLVLVSRFLPGWRIAVTFLAGATGMPRRTFLWASALSSVAWVVAMLTVGSMVTAVVGSNPVLVMLVSMGLLLLASQLWPGAAAAWARLIRPELRSAKASSGRLLVRWCNALESLLPWSPGVTRQAGSASRRSGRSRLVPVWP